MSRALRPQTVRAWILWAGLSLVIVLVVGVKLLRKDEDKSVFLPGKTTHGHYQIELACGECHESAFSDTSVLQKACERCHQEELKLAVDSHPKAKFLDPRNASRVAILDARYCVTCHQEHRPELVTTMGLSLPTDYCYRCHHDLGEERPSHQDLGFDTCASGGCHNFHDNRALYEDYLVAHANEPPNLETALLPALSKGPQRELAAPDAPAGKVLGAEEQTVFAASAHGHAGTRCSDCHGTDAQWVDSPGPERCVSCHDEQVEGWKRGRHGMRIGSGLSPMQADQARLPMKADAHATLGCTSCHGSHAFDTRFAAAQACQGCHDDEHTKNYAQSRHAQLWQDELAGKAPPGTGVSCATCHMPRVGDEGKVSVQHNQNDTLRPNEKMVRPICSHCHGVGFSLDALADAALVKSNFQGNPVRHVPSIDMAVARVKQ